MSAVPPQVDTLTQLQQMKAQLAIMESQVTTAPASVVTSVAEPGYTTTEFWGTQAISVLAVVAILHPGFHAPPGLAQAIAVAAAGIANGAYAIGRSFRKKNAVI